MNYSDPQLQSLLAAEFVLGSLHGRAAARFSRLLASEPGLREAVDYWQQRLNPLAEVLTPVTPPKHIWKNIQRAIQADRRPFTFISIWDNLNFWRGFALASMMLVIGFGLGAIQAIFERPVADTSKYIAILNDQRAQPMLVASIIGDSRVLQIDMLVDEQTTSDQVMQVWCVPKGGGKPMSIGLIASKTSRFEMTVDEMQMLHEAEEIVVSMEPPGGSPMDKPTGPVMYRGNVI
jgi:anti-sigma-K factor RskA